MSPWDATAAIAKAITYAATLGAAGGVALLAYSHDRRSAASGDAIRHLIRRLLIVAACATGAKILAMSASMSGGAAGMVDPALAGMILQTGEGPATASRLVGLILMLAAVAGDRRPPRTALAGAVLAATSFAWTGHVHATPAPLLPTVALAVHLLGVAFWLGALAPLLMVTADADVPRVAATVARFGFVALPVVGAMLAAAVCLLGLLLPDAGALWRTDYGRFFLVKIGLVAVLLATAAVNRLRLTPRLLANDTLAVRALRGSIRFEMGVAAGILVVTAALTTMMGP